jgi:hypothetical protein
MKLCKDCRHYNAFQDCSCTHPSLVDPITGQYPSWAAAHICRVAEALCGWGAAWWEKRGG